MHRTPRILVALALAGALPAQHGYTPEVQPASDDAANAIAGFKPAAGLEVSIVAAEPDLANPVAFWIDNRGRHFVVETHRLKFGVFDNRNHRYWLNEDLACLTVKDRVRMHQKHRADKLDADREHHELIRLLVDLDGDGVMDRSNVFADGFNELPDGIAAGVLVDGEDVWFTNIPKLWRLRDNDGDGVADERTAVQDGYGVHFSLIGHDMHGLRIGPDRRLYFSIGDRGLHVEHEGEVHAHPHTGAVLRCELDGSKLEVVHTGLRNPQELAFDRFGNLFTGDNNSDGGDRARWVYVVDGGETGWHIGFQWMSDRGAWHEDKLWHPQHEGQAAYIVPPICNLGHGPSGLTHYPGTGLPARYDDCFFLCDFRGGASNSGIYALQCRPKGAGFELTRKENLIWNVLATDVEFGPSGGIFVLDWVRGWNKPGRGRIYRVFDPQLEGDTLVAETAALLRADLISRPTTELIELLRHRDQRVRQRAQFALVDQGTGALDALGKAAAGPDHEIARHHAIWAIGIHGRRDPKVLSRIAGLLTDGDAEIRAQTAKVLGEGPYPAAREALEKIARDDLNDRARFFAAIALGRIGDERSAAALGELLRENHDKDAYLRHAGVMGFARIGSASALADAARDGHRSVRLGALLAMRRLEDPQIEKFLTDADPALVREAVRAIYDVGIDAAMPAVAALAVQVAIDADDDLPLVRRVLNANRLLGDAANAAALADYAATAAAPSKMRIEALRILGEWPKPGGQDRVFGDWRPLRSKSPLPARAALARVLDGLCADAPDDVCRVAAEIAGKLAVKKVDTLTALIGDGDRKPNTRDAGLRALERVAEPAMLTRVCGDLDGSAPVALRKTAIRILARLDPARSAPVLASLVENAGIGERQNALRALGELQDDAADAVICAWLDRLLAGELPPEIQLDLLEAAERRESRDVALRLEKFEAERANDENPLAAFAEVRHGGDAKAGRKVFFEKDTTMCMRCHTIGNRGGAAGPKLDSIGAKGREDLLAALLTPARDIAEGFDTVVVTLEDGTVVAGIASKETATALDLMDPESKVTTVEKAEIENRVTAGSSMPPMGTLLTKREMRDVIEFLAGRN